MGRILGFQGWPTHLATLQVSNEKQEGPVTFPEDFCILIRVALLYFHISDNCFKTMNQEKGEKEEKSLAGNYGEQRILLTFHIFASSLPSSLSK